MDTGRAKLVKEFHYKYRSRITAALPKYGEFDPATDKRNMASEAIEEVLDIGSYMEFGERMHPHLLSPIQEIRAKAILLYGKLKDLEDMIRTSNEEGAR